MASQIESLPSMSLVQEQPPSLFLITEQTTLHPQDATAENETLSPVYPKDSMASVVPVITAKLIGEIGITTQVEGYDTAWTVMPVHVEEDDSQWTVVPRDQKGRTYYEDLINSPVLSLLSVALTADKASLQELTDAQSKLDELRQVKPKLASRIEALIVDDQLSPYAKVQIEDTLYQLYKNRPFTSQNNTEVSLIILDEIRNQTQIPESKPTPYSQNETIYELPAAAD